MSERLSEEDIKQLDDAFEDGFRDDYLPMTKLVKVELGNLFETNPLNHEVLYYRASDGFDEDRVRSASSQENRDEDGLFKKVSWQSEMFWRNPFGFNFEKVEAYFREKQDDWIVEYVDRYNREVGEMWSEGLVDEAPNTFEQWVEGRIFPYTKRWFESSILYLINCISRAKKELDNFSDDLPFVGPEADITEAMRDSRREKMRDYRQEKMFRNSLILGRMVEHYRWKFQHEASIVQRKPGLQARSAVSGMD